MQGEDTQAADALDGAAEVLPAWDALLAALEAAAKYTHKMSDDDADIIDSAIDLARGEPVLATLEGREK